MFIVIARSGSDEAILYAGSPSISLRQGSEYFPLGLLRLRLAMTGGRGNMLERLYQKLWSRIGGRPWTYIIRDSARKYTLLWFLAWLIAGIILGHLWW